MHLIVMFDLPVKEKLCQKKAREFRSFLLSNGFSKIQNSVYRKTVSGYEACDNLVNKLTKYVNLNDIKGDIRAIDITDKQYSKGMKIISGNATAEELIGNSQYIEI